MCNFLTPSIQTAGGPPSGGLRVMYYNIYGYGDNPEHKVFPGPMDLRQEQQAACIALYAPDLLGLQEYDKKFREKMAPRLAALGYAEVPIDGADTFIYPAGKNCEPIFYKPDRLECRRSGGFLYPDTVDVDGTEVLGNNGHSKSLTWAVFSDRQTGACFIAICTHFMWSAPELTFAQAEAVRSDNARRLLRQIREIRAMDPAYADIPVVMGGDLNCTPDSLPCRVLAEEMTWAYDAATGQKDNLGYTGYATYDEKTGVYVKWSIPTQERAVIDYIWVQAPIPSALTVHSYFTVTDRLALLSSDHCPKVADLTLHTISR